MRFMRGVVLGAASEALTDEIYKGPHPNALALRTHLPQAANAVLCVPKRLKLYSTKADQCGANIDSSPPLRRLLRCQESPPVRRNTVARSP
jgi:hypothetical protein